MADAFEMPRIKLGSQGFEVSKLGFGCMGLSGAYNTPVPEEEGIAIIKEAFSKGVTFFDTSDFYGRDHANEYLVGKVVTTENWFHTHSTSANLCDPYKLSLVEAATITLSGVLCEALNQLPREKIQLATKFGICTMEENKMTVKGTPEYVRSCCEASVKRLQVDYIDLYYVHRIDTTVPIEETMGELKKLVEEGKIKYIGLSEAHPETIRRAHAVHPITTVQQEYSLWTRDIEDDIIPVCREHGIGIVSYSPVGRGLLAGKAVVESLPANSFLTTQPRFTGENFEKNKSIYFRLEGIAKKHGCTPAQLAISWILHQGDDIVPIPGTTKINNLHDNVGSVQVKLTEEDIKELSDAVSVSVVAGQRYDEFLYKTTYKFSITPTPTK